MDDDGRKAKKVPGESKRDLAGDLKAVEEPGSSVIWDGATVFQQTLTTTPRCCHGTCLPNPHDKSVPRGTRSLTMSQRINFRAAVTAITSDSSVTVNSMPHHCLR